MKDEARLDYHATSGTEDVASYLEEMAAGIRAHNVTMARGENDVTLELPDRVDLDVKASSSGKKSHLTVEVAWTRQRPASRGGLTIVTPSDVMNSNPANERYEEGFASAPPEARTPAAITNLKRTSTDAERQGDAPPFPDYDSLTVGGIVQRLRRLDAATIGVVRAYELQHKNRSTLLMEIDKVLAAA